MEDSLLHRHQASTLIKLGLIESLLETGANDVIIVQGNERQHAIPFIQPKVVLKIDLIVRKMWVDWDADF